MKQHFHFMLRILSLTVALLLGLSAVVYAQEITGNIAGLVKDFGRSGEGRNRHDYRCG